MAKSSTLAIGINILKNAEGNRLTQSQFLEAALDDGLERNRANGSIGAMVTQKLAVNPIETIDGVETVVLELTEAGKAWSAPVSKPAAVPMSLAEKREHKKTQRAAAQLRRKQAKAGTNAADLAGF